MTWLPVDSDPGAGISEALARYRAERPFIRLFTYGRHLLAPLQQIEVHVPTTGRVLDLGCGHGLFSNLMALTRPLRRILGVDPSPAKIEVARRSSSGLENVAYQEGVVDDVTARDFDAITILDVLYLLPDEKKLAVLRACRDRLASSGVLILKTNDTRPRWKYAVVRAEEELMVRIIGFTYGGEVHFRGIPEYLALLDEAGFEASVYSLDTWLPVPHRLYVARPI